jgi:2-keto-4-pentenoate hydratase/2-oxohepta-3-ene-1,7-dioic acid hydratase in catechol pathway
MRLATFRGPDGISYGAVVGNGIVDAGRRLGAKYPTLLHVLRAGALDEVEGAVRDQPADVALGDVALLPPLDFPEKIICIGINYANRNEEYRDGQDAPAHPSIFIRFPDTLVGHEAPVIRPTVSEQLDYEGEIVLVIGKPGRHVPKDRALDIVAGVTLANEGTVRDWLRHSKFNVTPGKNFDRSGSLGPWMVTTGDIDLAAPLHLTTRVNGEVRQDDTTDNMIFGFADLIAYITTFAGLKPGDLILTGTPTGAGARFDPPKWLKPGDVVEIEVPQIGVLRNPVAAEQ